MRIRRRRVLDVVAVDGFRGASGVRTNNSNNKKNFTGTFVLRMVLLAIAAFAGSSSSSSRSNMACFAFRTVSCWSGVRRGGGVGGGVSFLSRRRLLTESHATRTSRFFHSSGSSLSLSPAAAGGGGGGGGRVSGAVQDKSLLEKTSTTTTTKEQQSTKMVDADAAAAPAALDTNPPKGTRDFYPEDMRLRNWLFDGWRAVSSSYGFVEYDAPVLENEALYTRKAGEEVTEQLYGFRDRGDRPVALRPEMTPSLARMVLRRKGSLPMPLKWFSVPQCWRYERMTRGRRREHYQWNMDVWGVPDVRAEAELVAAMIAFFRRAGLTSTDVGVKVNSRAVLAEVLSAAGVPDDKFAAACVAVDKLDKVSEDAVRADLVTNLQLQPDAADKLLQVLSVKTVDGLRDALCGDGSKDDDDDESVITSSPALEQLQSFMDLCGAYGVSDWIVLDASVVRGLAYYTGIVFEAFDRRGQLRAIAGGGRYDRLLETFGGDSVPAAGFGFGDAVIVELLRDRNLLPSFDASGIDVVVYAFEEEQYPAAVKVASMLRDNKNKNKNSLSVDVVLESSKRPKWVFKHADRIGARYCCLIGDDEFMKNAVSIKDLSLGQQETVSMDELNDWIDQRSNK